MINCPCYITNVAFYRTQRYQKKIMMKKTCSYQKCFLFKKKKILFFNKILRKRPKEKGKQIYKLDLHIQSEDFSQCYKEDFILFCKINDKPKKQLLKETNEKTQCYLTQDEFSDFFFTMKKKIKLKLLKRENLWAV